MQEKVSDGTRSRDENVVDVARFDSFSPAYLVRLETERQSRIREAKKEAAEKLLAYRAEKEAEFKNIESKVRPLCPRVRFIADKSESHVRKWSYEGRF